MNEVKVKTRIQRISEQYFFEPTYDPPVWDPKEDPDFDPDETIYFYGVRREGKSTISRYLALLMRKLYPTVFVFSGTADNNFWQQVLPENKVFNVVFKPDGEVERTLNAPCERLLNINIARMTKWKNAQSRRSATGNPLVLVIGDDVITDNTVRKCPSVTRIMLNGRHHGIAGWILSQHWAGLTPMQRNNIDRFVLFSTKETAVDDWILYVFGAHVVGMYRRVVAEPFTAFVIVKKARIDGPRFYKFKADKEWVARMLARNKVLGNDRLWRGVDIEEQKERLPDVDMASKQTLIRRFNENVGEEASDDEVHDVAQMDEDEDAEPGTMAEVFRSW